MEYLRPMGRRSAVPFSWDNYPQLICRYDFSDPTTMEADGAAYFSGDNYLVNNGGAAALTPDEPLSMVCFFKTPAGAAARTLMWLGDSAVANVCWAMLIDANDKLSAYVEDGVTSRSVVSVATVDDDEWHFGAAVWTSRTTRTIYLDDAAAVSSTGTGLDPSSVDSLSLGATFRATPDLFLPADSKIDAAMLFSVALTADQVAWLYNSGAGRTYQELVDSADANNPGVANLDAFWGLDEHTGIRRDEMDNLHLTEAGTTTPIDGHGGVVEFEPVVEDRAAEFDGSSYLKVDSAIVSAYPFSMVCWFNVTPVVGGGGRGVMWLGDKDANNVDHGMYIVNGVMVTYSQNGATQDGAVSAVPADQDDQVWRMVAGVWGSSTSRRVSVDGNATVENATDIAIGAVDRFAIGAFARSTPGVMVVDGDKIDNAMVFNIALSDDQIAWLYNGGAGRRYDELVDSADANNPGVANLVEFYKLSQHQEGRFVTGAHADTTLTQVGTLVDAEGIAAAQSRPGGVAYIQDLSDNAHHMMSEVNEIDKRVYLVEDDVGYAVRTISTSAQALEAAEDLTTYAQPVTHFCVAAFEGIEAATNGLLFDGVVNDRHILYYDTDGNVAMTTDVEYPTAITGSAAQDGVEELFVCEFDGAASRLYRNGASADADGDLGTGVFDPATMGSSTVSGLLTSRFTMRHYSAFAGTTTAEKNAIGQQVATDADLTWQTIEDRAAQFGSNASWLYVNTCPISAYPFSMVCWFRIADYTSSRCLMWIGDKDYSSIDHGLYMGTQQVAAYSNDGSGLVQTVADTPAQQDDGTWRMAAGVWAGATSRKCCVDANTLIENTTSKNVGALDRMSIGMFGRATTAAPIRAGNALDNAMLFSIALTQDQITWLYNSGHGRTLEELEDSLDANNPGVANLVAYYPLWVNQTGGVGRDVKGNYTMAPLGVISDSAGV